jgi:hypothetical protein
MKPELITELDVLVNLHAALGAKLLRRTGYSTREYLDRQMPELARSESCMSTGLTDLPKGEEEKWMREFLGPWGGATYWRQMACEALENPEHDIDILELKIYVEELTLEAFLEDHWFGYRIWD